MPDHRSIEDVGTTLIALLRDRMGHEQGQPSSTTQPISDAAIALVSPGEIKETSQSNEEQIRLSLYLYWVEPSKGGSNRPHRGIDATTVRDAPLSLDCYYLLTAYLSKGTGDETTKREEQHRVLGRAMQVLRDDAVVREGDLSGTLSTPLHVSPVARPTGEILDIWNTFDGRPYQPSVAYLVTPVEIDPAEDREVGRVLERETQYHVRDRAAERAEQEGTDGG